MLGFGLNNQVGSKFDRSSYIQMRELLNKETSKKQLNYEDSLLAKIKNKSAYKEHEGLSLSKRHDFTILG